MMAERRAKGQREKKKKVGRPLELPTVGDAEFLSSTHGSTFLVTNRHGDIVPPGARELGLFRRDTRHLSHLALTIVRGELVHLSSDSAGEVVNQVDLMVSDVEDAEFLDDPKNFLHIRRRQFLDVAFVEEITLTNYLTHAVEISLEIAFAADFADIFEVRGARRPRRGTYREPKIVGSSVVFEYQGLCGDSYVTTVAFDPPPKTLAADRASFKMRFEADEVHRIVVEVQCGNETSKPRARTKRETVEKRVANLERNAAAQRAKCTAFSCDDPLLARVLERSSADVHTLNVDLGPRRIIGAGIPWFCSPFGRDSLLTAYSLLTYSPEFAVDALRTLAAYQGKRFRDETEEEPGKIFHELRFGEMTKAGETPHSPYYGSADATPLFVVLADAAYDVLGDLALVRELRPAIVAALKWIDVRSSSGKRLVTYERRTPRGIENQCWKDSRAGVSAPDGTRAKAPVAICEIQGYCIDAYLRGARLLGALGEPDLQASYLERAERLRAVFEEQFWLPKKKRYAYAIDGEGRVLDTVVSNAGHLLWSRAVPKARARLISEQLLSEESFSGFGVRTLASGQAVYNPLSYHNGTVWPHDNAIIVRGLSSYDRTNDALKIFEGLHGAMAHFRDHRLPELFCGIARSEGPLVRYPVACSPQAWAAAAPFLLLQSILGIEPDAPNNRLLIREPKLPEFLRWVELKRMRIGSSFVSMRFRRQGKRCHVEDLEVDGPGIHTRIEIP